jgi:hypothetical protein
MPVHDWTRVDASIFHAFHQQWMIAISNALNEGILPKDYYALPEKYAAVLGPDVLTLQGSPEEEAGSTPPGRAVGRSGLLLAPPKLTPTGETNMEFYRRKQTSIAVRHVSGDRVVAMIEVVSSGNKSVRSALRSFVEKATELVGKGIHLLLVDLYPPGRHDTGGIHAAI